MGEHLLERDEAVAVADREIARQSLGHLHAREALLPVFRVAHEDRQADREARDVGERLPRADRERRQHRIDVAVVAALQVGALGVREVLDPHDDDALGGERRAELLRPDPRLLRLQLERALTSFAKRLLRGAPVGGARGDPGRRLPAQAGDPHHEELVEHRREDRAEPHSLEQRQVRVLCERKDASGVIEERQLAVDEPIGRGCHSLFSANSGHTRALYPLRQAISRGDALVTVRLRSGYVRS